MRKRFYILFVARDPDGELRKIPIPLHYLYVFLAGAILGMFTITGMAGSYARMLVKVASFNKLRADKVAIQSRYTALEKVAKERETQVASLGSIASQVSVLYGLKPDPVLTRASENGDLDQEAVDRSLDQFYALKKVALSGAATIGINAGLRNLTITDWMRMSAAPSLWPVEGHITSSFGQRMDPFNGEGAYHRGVDISAPYGSPIIAPADGEVLYSDFMSGYGRMIVIDHGNGYETRYGHLASFVVTAGQTVHRGDTIGYVGLSGRSTGPHLHYEVWVHNNPVPPYRFLRLSSSHFGFKGAGS